MSALITSHNAVEFFKDSVHDAATNQRVDAAPETLHYLVTLLSEYTHSSKLFSRGPEGITLTPIAELYFQALKSKSATQRDASLRRLGDIALFVTGTFSAFLSRKGLSCNYYMAMGGTAYGCLAEEPKSANTRVLSDTFHELSEKFESFVDVVAEVNDSGKLNNDACLMQAYGDWMRNGDRQAQLLLRRAGVFPVQPEDSKRH